MEIMDATVARKMTIEAIEDVRNRILDAMNTRILTNVSLGKFKCAFEIDSPVLQDTLFDYFTARNYTVHFSPNEKNGKKYYDPDSRIMTISWEDAIE